jgi:hypothetical protein
LARAGGWKQTAPSSLAHQEENKHKSLLIQLSPARKAKPAREGSWEFHPQQMKNHFPLTFSLKHERNREGRKGKESWERQDKDKRLSKW